MGTHEGSADRKDVGWRFHVPVCLGIVGGVFFVVLVELVNARRPLVPGFKDVCLVVGGMLLGLIALCLNEVLHAGPERLREAEERDTEHRRHQEERRLDFEQYRALQSELRDTRLRADRLQAKLDLTGAIDRDRVGDALLLGFYFNLRADRLSKSGRSIFETAALRLKVLPGPTRDVRLDKSAIHNILEIAYGPVVAEAFDLGYLLSHLGEDGRPTTSSPQILAELERHLKALKLDAEIRTQNGPPGNAGLLTKLASRIFSIVRGMR